MVLIGAMASQGIAQAPGAQATRLEGTVTVLWFDPARDSGLEGGVRLTLTADDGRHFDLTMTGDQIEAAGGLTTLNRSRIRVEGRLRDDRADGMVVDVITPLDVRSGRETNVFGSQPYVWLLFRFADNSTTPQPPSWFERQALGDYPSMDHFWRQVSFNNINLLGSLVIDWHTLPHNRSWYVYDMDPENPNDEFDAARFLADAIPLAEPHVYFPDFVGVHFCFNGDLDGYAWGGTALITADGESRIMGATYLPPWGWEMQAVVGHEGGHAFGLPHSGGQYGNPYDSFWDLESRSEGTGVLRDPIYGAVGTHVNAFHKNMLGWIHPLHRFVMPTTPAVAQFWLNDLVVVPPAGRYLMAAMMYPGTDNYMSLERRRFNGYDQNVAAESVVLHDVVLNRDRPSQVFDYDGNGDPNDAGAQWEPGETMSLLTPWQWVITVEAKDATGSLVTMSNAARSTVYVDDGFIGTEDGSASHPWDTFFEGTGSVYPAGNVYIAPAAYGETMMLRKPATYRRWGSTGIVTIGQ
jgi:hypothetical protein